jgi:hypothetical protein
MVQYRTPGPIGRLHATDRKGHTGGPGFDWLPPRGGAAPGPLGTLWDKKSNAPPKNAVANITRTRMPPPLRQDDVVVHVVPTPRFGSSTGAVSYKEIMQSPAIANCPVAAILAALAFTSWGRAFIQGMLSETAASVLTDLSGAKTNHFEPPKAPLSSPRYFKVKLKGAWSAPVSDVLYTDDHDSGWSPFYLRDPNDNTIWAAIIEKALAAQLGGYDEKGGGYNVFMDQDITLNTFWELITGAAPDGFAVTSSTPLDKIIAAAKASTSVPAVASSKPNGPDVTIGDKKIVTEFHGYAVMGMHGSKIQLYDAMDLKMTSITANQFRQVFQTMHFRK